MVSLKDIKNILSNINIKEDYILIHSNLLIFDKFNFSILSIDDSVNLLVDASNENPPDKVAPLNEHLFIKFYLIITAFYKTIRNL